MPRDGSGNYTRDDGTRQGTTVWDKAKAAGVKIVSSDHDTHDQDMADAIGASVAKDGQTPMTGDLNMGGNDITNYGGLFQTVAVPIFISFPPSFVSGSYTYGTQTGQAMELGKLRWINYQISATVTAQSGNLKLTTPVNPNLSTSVTLGNLTIGGTKQNDITSIISTLGQIEFFDSSNTLVPVPVVSTVITVDLTAVYRIA